jgi:DNA-directed RNA polymerase specialized sigma24 family protein
MKHREIAKLINIAEGTSKSHLHDARALLRRRLQKQLVAANINSGV